MDGWKGFSSCLLIFIASFYNWRIEGLYKEVERTARLKAKRKFRHKKCLQNYSQIASHPHQVVHFLAFSKMTITLLVDGEEYCGYGMLFFIAISVKIIVNA